MATATSNIVSHTPGPWTVETQPSDTGLDYITGHITSPLHTYCGNRVERADSITAPSSMTRADARLIAAAPDLLAALRELVEMVRGESLAKDTAIAAIARAEGREP